MSWNAAFPYSGGGKPRYPDTARKLNRLLLTERMSRRGVKDARGRCARSLREVAARGRCARSLREVAARGRCARSLREVAARGRCERPLREAAARGRCARPLLLLLGSDLEVELFSEGVPPAVGLQSAQAEILHPILHTSAVIKLHSKGTKKFFFTN